MSAGLANQLREAIQKQRMLRPGRRVAVAVSGGADSVALLLLLLEIRAQLGVVLSVAHFNHKLRGRSSDSDERFVAILAARHDLVFHAQREDVRAQAQRDKANLETTARRSRYAFFATLIADGQADCVAVAHTQDDQAETVLGHILRGTGLRGLAGIHPRTDQIIRPLLGFRRDTLRAYLKSQDQRWREDPTNQDTSRLRARIRKQLLPLLEKKFQPKVVAHLCTLAELAREDSAWLETAATQQLDASCEFQDGKTRIFIPALLNVSALLNSNDRQPVISSRPANAALNRSMARRIVRIIAQKLKPHPGQLTSQHVEAILELAEHVETGKSLPLPGGLYVQKVRDSLIFSAMSERQTEKSGAAKQFEHGVDLQIASAGTLVRLPHLGCVIRFTAIDWVTQRRETSPTGAVLDRQLLRSPLVLRNWRAGDIFQPLGHHRAHKLKHLLSDRRIGLQERQGWPVLTSDGVLVWARGFPAAKEFAASEKTRAGIVIAEEVLQ
jgi:tRNA(Ile)-lysidine synthase